MATVADAWRPTSELEHRLQETVRAGDQESYFRLLADSELVVPVPPELVDGVLANEAQPSWPTQEEDGRVHVLAYTSASAMRACLGPAYQHFMTVRFGDIAETWPDARWWLAIDAPAHGVGTVLPIEARMPAWFVRQVAEGDGRPPQVGRAPAPWEELRDQHRDLPRQAPRPEFQPANDVERELLRAAANNDHDLFLQTLAGTDVLLPVPDDTDFTLRPGRPGFPWQTREVDGSTVVPVFTSAERLHEAAGTGAEYIKLPFTVTLRYWPNPDWLLAINSGSPAGGTVLAQQLPGLATWADQRAAQRMTEHFEPQNDIEQRLFDAARRRDTDAFYKILLGAQVLVPADADTPWGIVPGDADFPWRPVPVHGRTSIQVFTSLKWMNEAIGSSRFIMPSLHEMVAAWPDTGWTLVLNPGTPIDAAMPGDQIRTLRGPATPPSAATPPPPETPDVPVAPAVPAVPAVPPEGGHAPHADPLSAGALGAPTNSAPSGGGPNAGQPASAIGEGAHRAPDPSGIAPGGLGDEPGHGAPHEPLPGTPPTPTPPASLGAPATPNADPATGPSAEQGFPPGLGEGAHRAPSASGAGAADAPSTTPAAPAGEMPYSDSRASETPGGPAGHNPQGPRIPAAERPGKHGFPSQDGVPGGIGAPGETAGADLSGGGTAPGVVPGHHSPAPHEDISGIAASTPPSSAGSPGGPAGADASAGTSTGYEPGALAGGGAYRDPRTSGEATDPAGGTAADHPAATSREGVRSNTGLPGIGAPTEPGAGQDPTANAGGTTYGGSATPGEPRTGAATGTGAGPEPAPSPGAATYGDSAASGEPHTGATAEAGAGHATPADTGEATYGDTRDSGAHHPGATGAANAGQEPPGSPGAATYSGPPASGAHHPGAVSATNAGQEPPGSPSSATYGGSPASGEHPIGATGGVNAGQEPSGSPGSATYGGPPASGEHRTGTTGAANTGQEPSGSPGAATYSGPAAFGEAQVGATGSAGAGQEAAAGTGEAAYGDTRVSGQDHVGVAGGAGAGYEGPAYAGEGAYRDPRTSEVSGDEGRGAGGGDVWPGMVPGDERGQHAGPPLGGPSDAAGPASVPGSAGVADDPAGAGRGPVARSSEAAFGDARASDTAGEGGVGAAHDGEGAYGGPRAVGDPAGGAAQFDVSGAPGEAGRRPGDLPPGAADTDVPGGRGLRAVEDPEPAFEPGNRIDQELYEAASGGDSDAFLRVLLNANVLVPIPDDAPLEATPVQREFRWDAALRGEAAVQVFTSLVRLREVLPESRFVYADFRELIGAWPREDWAMLLNPGTRIGASLQGDQVRALSEWAVRVGLVPARPEVSPPPPRPEPAAAQLPSDLDDRVSSPTIMQKVVPHGHVAWYLEQGYDRVGGFVHSTGDVAELQTPGQLYEALGLLYEGSPFSPADDGVYVVRWPAYCPDLYRVPFGGRDEAELAEWGEAGWVIERPPFLGGGFAPGSAGSIREYKVDSVRLPYGAEMYYLGRDRTERFVAMYDPDRLAWLRPEAGPEGWDERTEAAQ
ncbi:SseB family protein [Actinomadura sp. GTD37]|uniref:SseB family protein n=1 Tax=Actinomadura sp. GTD37 TaxID=1778030 RepID=UPI0035BF7580